MIRIALCDDSKNELENIEKLTAKYVSLRCISCEFTSFQSGLDLIAKIEQGVIFDIYCLDILMPGQTGMETAKEIRKHDNNAQILFLTSSAEFAIESYSVKAVNYILKPITREKYFTALDDMLEIIRKSQSEDIVILKSIDGLQKILIENLVFVEVITRSVYYHLVSGRVIECVMSFSKAAEMLDAYSCFLKSHRSYIVNMKYIDKVDSTGITLTTLSKIPVAQGKMHEMKQRYLAYLMGGN